MTLIVLAFASLGLAALPALLYLRNRTQFIPPPMPAGGSPHPQISVLIPARNEERSIAAAVESVLASRGVVLEAVVLDDQSTDRTAEIVRELATKDRRVRFEAAPPLPDGWCGKQHACFTLSKHARFPILTFLDADVRLAPDALARMAAFLDTTRAELVSGFPRQETGTLLEQLVLPLINWLLVGYLPLSQMRASRQPGLGAGCGQWFMTRRGPYDAAGGHAAVRASRHDGITLPRAYRTAGFTTDVCDATDLATCRMYRSAGEVWNGLAKNAREGLGAPGLIWVWTVLLFGGQVLPFPLLALGLDLAFAGEVSRAVFADPDAARGTGWRLAAVSGVGCVLALAPRLACAARFRQSWLGAALHPVSVSALLAIQWHATLRAWAGRPVGWKGRPAPAHTSSSSATA